MMPKLVLEDYCDGCVYFEPETDSEYVDEEPCVSLVFCANRRHCAHVAHHFKKNQTVKLGDLLHD